MKQKDLITKMYEASLRKDWKQIFELRKAELTHILTKRSQGKTTFSPKWIVTDR